jgi:dephospho-CoA kinase
MKLLVIGHARHGKDTFCEMLRDRYGMQFTSSSLVACQQFLFDLAVSQGMDYCSQEDLYIRRGEVRKWMHEEIRKFNDVDLTRLARLVTKDNDIYCGMRNREELEACKAAGVFDVVIWVDASERLPPEPIESMQLCKDDADIIIDNNGTLKDLQDQADFMMVMLRLGVLEGSISERAAEVTDLEGITNTTARLAEKFKTQAPAH